MIFGLVIAVLAVVHIRPALMYVLPGYPVSDPEG
jgi:hypothetical protein